MSHQSSGERVTRKDFDRMFCLAVASLGLYLRVEGLVEPGWASVLMVVFGALFLELSVRSIRPAT